VKKNLLTTTAIAAATGLAALASPADAAERLKLGIGGYFQAYVGYFDASDNGFGIAGTRDYRSFDFFKESEIHFNGEVALDNGMKVGVDVQLEGETSADMIDESYLYFQGDFGKVILGSENSAAYLMSYGAPAVDSNFDGADPNYAFNPLADTFGGGYSTLAYVPNITSDSEKITYISPRFAGFALGLSYTPDNTEDAGSSAIPGRSDDGTVGQGRSQNSAQRDVWEFAANYENKFGDFGVLAGITYGIAMGVEDRGTGANVDEQEDFSVGLNLTYAGFTLGGGYYWTNQGFQNNGDLEAIAVGLSWANGPLRIAASFLNYDIEAAAVTGTFAIQNPGEDASIQRYGLGASYTYAPGMQLRGSAYYFDFNGDDGPNGMFAVLFGTVLTF
jgi:predicted porin